MAEVTRAELAEALTEFRLAVRTGAGYQSGPVGDPEGVAGVLHAALSRIAAERKPDSAPAADDAHARETGRVEDDQGRVVIVGIDHGTVTLRTLRPGDLITYRPVHADAPGPHRGQVESITADGIRVAEQAPGPQGLVHLVSWDRLLGADEAVALSSYRAEEFAQLLVAACWQAGWYQRSASSQGKRDVTARLRQAAAVRVLIAAALLAIAAVRAARIIRHPVLHARRLAARIVRRVPGRPDDGDPLTDSEMRAFIAICRGWKHAAPERTRP
jgi:tellurite resistance protein